MKPVRRTFDRVLLSLVLMLAAVASLPAQMAAEFRVAGLDVGASSEAQAVKRFGQGLRVEVPGGGVTHIYEDPSGRASLFVVCGPEGLIDEVQLMEGLARPYASTMKPRIPLASQKTGAGLPLGCSRERVMVTYGPPQNESTIGGLQWLTYRTDFSRDRRVRLSYQMSLGFRGGRLVRILLHNG